MPPSVRQRLADDDELESAAVSQESVGQLQQLTDVLIVNNEGKQQSAEETNYGITSSTSRHLEICKRATNTYWHHVHKKSKIHNQYSIGHDVAHR